MTLLRSSFTGLAAALLLAGPSRAGTFTVDDNGPANFASITAAIAAVAPGDVLLVMPGLYGAFSLDKSLTILGPGNGPRPIVTGGSTVTATSFTLAGLQLNELELTGVSGAARIDDCLIQPRLPSGAPGVLRVGFCAHLLVTRSVLDGRSLPSIDAMRGLYVHDSTAAFVDCSIFGADALKAPAGICGYSGADAALLVDGTVQLTACSLLGGLGGISGCFSQPSDGDSGDGLSLDHGDHDLRGGTSLSAGSGPPGWRGDYGWAYDHVGGTLVIGGVSIGLGSVFNGQGTLITPSIPEPTLRVLADTPQSPGGFGQLEWSAPAGAPGILLVSLGGALTKFNKLDEKLWPQLPALVELPITAGTDPTTLDYTLPNDSSLIATVVTLQAIFPTVAGAQHPSKVAVTNPAQIVIRF